jgi:hypothetical protein
MSVGRHSACNMLSDFQIPLCEVYAIDQTTLTLENYAHSELHVTGTIPTAWEQAGAFPVLQIIYLDNTLLTGTLPPTWGSQAALHELQSLFIDSCNIIGKSAF